MRNKFSNQSRPQAWLRRPKTPGALVHTGRVTAPDLPLSDGGASDPGSNQGAAPVETEGQITATASGATGGVTAYLFRGGNRDTVTDLATLPKLVGDDKNLVWIDLSEYARRDLESLAPLLNLDPSTVDATLADWERPRVQVFSDYFYMSTTVLRADTANRKLEAGELNIVSGRNYLLTAHKRALPFAEEVLDRLTQSPELATLHTAYVLYIVIDELIEYFEHIFEEVEDEIERTEEQALTESSDAFLADHFALKRHIFALGRFTEQHRGVFAVLTRPDFTHVSGEDIEPYFKDLQADLARLLDRLSAASSSVTAAFEIYVSQVAHRTNALIKALTLISTVILPTSLIVAFFSTGFTSIKVLQSPQAFIVMLVLLVVTPAVMLAVFRSRKLI